MAVSVFAPGGADRNSKSSVEISMDLAGRLVAAMLVKAGASAGAPESASSHAEAPNEPGGKRIRTLRLAR